MDPDATYKSILSYAIMVEELMHWLVADRHGMHALVDALDFSTLTRMHEQSVSDAGAARRFRSTDRLAPVLPIVLYAGNARWTAARRVIDLVTPQATQTGGTSGAPWRADPRFAGDGYVLLDSLRVRPEDLRHDNAAALLAGLENPSDETYAGLLAALQQRLRAPEFRGLKKILLAWAAWQARRRLGLELEVEDMMEADRLEDYGDVEAYFAARIQARKEEHRAEGREAGREEGRVMGQRESMRRQAAMKFDAETAARLGAVLEGVTNQEVFDGVLAALLGMRHAVRLAPAGDRGAAAHERAQRQRPGRLLNSSSQGVRRRSCRHARPNPAHPRSLRHEPSIRAGPPQRRSSAPGSGCSRIRRRKSASSVHASAAATTTVPGIPLHSSRCFVISRVSSIPRDARTSATASMWPCAWPTARLSARPCARPSR